MRIPILQTTDDLTDAEMNWLQANLFEDQRLLIFEIPHKQWLALIYDGKFCVSSDPQSTPRLAVQDVLHEWMH